MILTFFKELLFDGFDVELELVIGFEVIDDGLNGTQNGRVIASTEGASEIGQGERRVGAGQVHGDFSGVAQFFFSRPSHDFLV